MLSQSGIYALQAVLHLAQQPPATSVSAARMARELSVPPGYLAKVLSRLSREGLLASSRGARGGYRLERGATELSVEEVVAPFEELGVPKRCLLGGLCDPKDYCTAHSHRLEWVDVRRRILRNTSVIDLLAEPLSNQDSVNLATPALNQNNGS